MTTAPLKWRRRLGKRPSSAVPAIAPPRLVSVISDFQSDAVALEERPPPRIARGVVYTLTALIAAAIFWASISEMDEIVIAPGKLVTTRPIMMVQPFETSIIRSLDVSLGEIVEKGQVIATLDPTFSQADVDQQDAKYRDADAQIGRIEAEMTGSDYLARAGNSPAEQLQAALYTQRRAFLGAQLQNYDAQLATQMAIIASGDHQANVLEDRRNNLARIETARDNLQQQRAGSLVAFLDARDARLEIDASISAVRGKAAEAMHALQRVAAEKQAFIEDNRRTLTEQLIEARNQREVAMEELKKMDLRRSMITLKAPARGVVSETVKRSVGSVVQEAEPIATLVPIDVPLEAEVSVPAADIARIAEGRAVRVKLDAYPFQKFGTASGIVRTISRDTFTSTQEEVAAGYPTTPFFRARLTIAEETLRLPQQDVLLLPGMTVSAEINVGRRTVMSYLLYPLHKGLDTALREP